MLNKARGFAGMGIKRRREIARIGGKTAHALGLAHEFSSEEAKKAYKLSRQKKGGN